MNLQKMYKQAKQEHSDKILLFRIGDFYEIYNTDAEMVCHLLNTVLTSTSAGLKMTGFPHSHLEVNLQKLLREGLKVAILDQVK